MQIRCGGNEAVPFPFLQANCSLEWGRKRIGKYDACLCNLFPSRHVSSLKVYCLGFWTLWVSKEKSNGTRISKDWFSSFLDSRAKKFPNLLGWEVSLSLHRFFHCALIKRFCQCFCIVKTAHKDSAETYWWRKNQGYISNLLKGGRGKVSLCEDGKRKLHKVLCLAVLLFLPGVCELLLNVIVVDYFPTCCAFLWALENITQQMHRHIN